MKTGDDIFEEIFGYQPPKRGAGYEILVACVLQFLNQKASVKHNVIRKAANAAVHNQLDAIVKQLDGEETVVEAKDYKNKVGREVIAKNFGDITALQIPHAIVVTPNGYTAGAQEYTQLPQIKDTKHIDLYIIREAKDSDYERPSGVGIVKKITCNIVMRWILFAQGKYKMISNESSKEPQNIEIRLFYKRDGTEVPIQIMADDISKHHSPLKVEKEITGAWYPKEELYLKAANQLLNIQSIKYTIPVSEYKVEVKREITPPVMFVKTDMEDTHKNYRLVDKQHILQAYKSIRTH